MKQPEEFDSPAEFLFDGIYRFPFMPLDADPGPRRLGRIEWRIEPLVEPLNGLGGLLVCARQTRDPRYRGKIFRIELKTERIFGRHLTNPDDFLKHVWAVEPCSTHQTLALVAYPENHHRELIIDPASSIGIDITFAN
jgi:hypothetical protein